MKRARIDREWLPKVTRVGLNWGYPETDLFDADTGVVVYTTLSTMRALERALAFVREHRLALVEFNIIKEMRS